MNNLRLRGGVWHCDFRDYKTRKRVRASLDTNKKSVASIRLKQLLNACENGSYWITQHKSSSISLETFAEEFIRTDLQTWSSLKGRQDFEKELRNWIVPTLGANKALNEITTADLANVRAKLYFFSRHKKDKRNKNSYANRAFTNIRVFLNKAVEKGYLENNPASKIKPLKNDSKPSRVLQDGELNKILMACKQPLRDMVLLAYFTGLRAGEITQLDHRALVFDGNRYWITLDYIKTKNNKSRKIPIHQSLVPMLEMRVKRKGLLFASRITQKQYHYKKTWSRILESLNLHGLTFHGLRRSFITDMRRGGVDTHTIQRLAGHSRITQTEQYIDRERAEEKHLTASLSSLDHAANSLTNVIDFPKFLSQVGHK